MKKVYAIKHGYFQPEQEDKYDTVLERTNAANYVLANVRLRDCQQLIFTLFPKIQISKNGLKKIHRNIVWVLPGCF